ncbi:hypothetical protein AMS68_001919 [Peltaster fructicola]|uniref:PX domain-containing protein n=1 Tax=Peltaster fructicola TaxID=286661 RepID=A0A6H0XNR6_9PEZI|nr:hypothetical protein AMS68_001919 [Peltaster fructicola]
MDAPARDVTNEEGDVSITAPAALEIREDALLRRPQTQSTHSGGSVTSNPAAPPFWSRHGRSVSQVSYQSLVSSKPAAIRLEDHSEEDNVQTQGCWASSVTINDYVIISGTSGIGAYVVWNCTVDTLKGGAMAIRKRYSEFDKLRIDLVTAFPHAAGSIPVLPRKSVVSRFRTKFLEQRKNGLNHFMKYAPHSEGVYDD